MADATTRQGAVPDNDIRSDVQQTVKARKDAAKRG